MLSTSLLQFKYYRQLGFKAMEQVDEDCLFLVNGGHNNSIAMIIQHLSGNMISRWTNIFTEDGEKPWRDRDKEFEVVIHDRTTLLKVWDEGWQCLFDSLAALNASDLDRIIYIRNEGMTVSDAILRQLCHYSYHVGQIVLLSKQYVKGEWKSLSIPKNASQGYNQQKFDQIKAQKHFLNSLLEDGS